MQFLNILEDNEEDRTPVKNARKNANMQYVVSSSFSGEIIQNNTVT
jgi:hypothetical protein